MTYATGHVKRNTETGETALRTVFPEDTPQMAALAWLVSTTNQGARNATGAEVESWADLYVPPAE